MRNFHLSFLLWPVVLIQLLPKPDWPRIFNGTVFSRFSLFTTCDSSTKKNKSHENVLVFFSQTLEISGSPVINLFRLHRRGKWQMRVDVSLSFIDSNFPIYFNDGIKCVVKVTIKLGWPSMVTPHPRCSNIRNAEVPLVILMHFANVVLRIVSVIQRSCQQTVANVEAHRWFQPVMV